MCNCAYTTAETERDGGTEGTIRREISQRGGRIGHRTQGDVPSSSTVVRDASAHPAVNLFMYLFFLLLRLLFGAV